MKTVRVAANFGRPSRRMFPLRAPSLAMKRMLLVTAGAQHAFDLLARVLVEPGHTRVALEDPGHLSARMAFAAAGARIVAVPVDEEGMRVDCIPRRRRRDRDDAIAPVSARNGDVAASPRRAVGLRSCPPYRGGGRRYDGEFRFSGRPLDALRTVDERQVVFYVGTFSKSLYPSLRLGYIIPPRGPRLRLSRPSGSTWGTARRWSR